MTEAKRKRGRPAPQGARQEARVSPRLMVGSRNARSVTTQKERPGMIPILLFCMITVCFRGIRRAT